ncbi:hypothetical protein CJ203_04375 [Corynebacterium tuscaniense]|uniref:Uncharacterized protein n=1 Tax=Corynebacterium tuscaniense TaxID=302449 RepID=A0A2N6T5H2_9CORY|nr:hypothetical protein [Corynebacterium tuscaniense]PMC64561.1 hypothetical protein CJ203_04375 [Corynebacterium tuscaniense]
MADDKSPGSQKKAIDDHIAWLRKTYGIGITGDETETAETEKQLAHQEDVEVDAKTKSMEKELLRKEKLRNDELENRIAHQEKFFNFSLAIIGIPVLAASIGFIILLFKKSVGDVAYAAFFASVVAEVIGLSYILGRA